MTFWVTVVIIFIASFLWALFNLNSELSKPKHLKKMKEHKKRTSDKQNLEKEKILFER